MFGELHLRSLRRAVCEQLHDLETQMLGDATPSLTRVAPGPQFPKEEQCQCDCGRFPFWPQSPRVAPTTPPLPLLVVLEHRAAIWIHLGITQK